MVNTVRALEMLKSSKASKRIEACEELGAAESLSTEAINALKSAISDPDPQVADAASRALGLHTSQSTEVSVETIPTPTEAVAVPRPVHSWTRPFVIYGVLAGGIPIPFLPWLWLILSISTATKLGWQKGLLGVGIFFGTGFAARLVLGLIVVAFSGGY